MKTIDGKPIYGHMDYGKKDPSLGWRFTDAWLSMAGEADIGIPNGMPVDEWGIRVAADKCTPVGASVSRRAARFRRQRRLRADQVRRLDESTRPKEATGMTFGEGGADCRRKGPDRAADLLVHHRVHRRWSQAGLPVVNADGHA